MNVIQNDSKGINSYKKVIKKFDDGVLENSPNDKNAISVNIEFLEGSNKSIEDLVSPNDFSTLEMKYDDINKKSNEDKLLFAHNFYQKVVKQKVELSSDTLDNFRKIFSRIDNNFE